MTSVPKATLRPGYEISQLIKGGWQLAGDHGRVEADRAVDDMGAFARAGITTFDCADIYAGVEAMIGRFLAGLAGTDPALRGSIRVHTKFVPDRDSLATIGLRDVEAVIDRSLARLGAERLDLVQFHWWDYAVPGHVEAIGHLDRLRAAGKINLIGVTNFDAGHLAGLCDVADIASAQVQYSLLDNRAAGSFAETARARNVALLCYGVLAGGLLTDAWLGRPDPGHGFENRSLVKYRLIVDEFGGWELLQALLAALRRVADRHRADIATIAIRATLDSADVTAAIVGARYARNLAATLRAFDLDLTDRDRQEIDAVLAQRTGPQGPVYGLERDIGGRHGRIMKYNLGRGDTDTAPGRGARA